MDKQATSRPAGGLKRLLPELHGRVDGQGGHHIFNAWAILHGWRGINPDAICKIVRKYGKTITLSIYEEELWPAVFPLSKGGQPIYLSPSDLFAKAQGKYSGRHIGFYFSKERPGHATLISYSSLALVYAAFADLISPRIEATETYWKVSPKKLFREDASPVFSDGLSDDEKLSTWMNRDAFLPASPFHDVDDFRDWGIRFPLADAMAECSPGRFRDLGKLKNALGECWCGSAGRIADEQSIGGRKLKSALVEWKRLVSKHPCGHLAFAAAHRFPRAVLVQEMADWKYPDQLVQVAAWLLATAARRFGVQDAALLPEPELKLVARFLARAYLLSNPKSEIFENNESSLTPSFLRALREIQIPFGVWKDGSPFVGKGGKSREEDNLLRTLRSKFCIELRRPSKPRPNRQNEEAKNFIDDIVPNRVLPRFLTRAELAATLETTPQTLRDLEKKGLIQFQSHQPASDKRNLFKNIFNVVPDDAVLIEELRVQVHGVTGLSLKEFAAELHVEERTLRRKFKRMGISGGWQEVRRSRPIIEELYRRYSSNDRSK